MGEEKKTQVDWDKWEENEEKIRTAEALKFLRTRVVGFQASNNVFRVIDEEILKYDKDYVPDTPRDRRKFVFDRNIQLQKSRELVGRLEPILKDLENEDWYWERHPGRVNGKIIPGVIKSVQAIRDRARAALELIGGKK